MMDACRVKWVEIPIHRTVWCKEVTWPPDSVETQTLPAQIFCWGLILFGQSISKRAFCSIKRCVPLQRPRVSSQRLWRLCSGLGADPYMEWASRSRVFVGLVGALGKHRVPSIQIGGILKLLEKRSSAKRRVTFESTTLQSFRFDVIWRDLMWFVDVCAGWKTLHTIITTDGSQYYINKHWLSQWPSFKLLGITYLVGNIKFKLLFHGPLAE